LELTDHSSDQRASLISNDLVADLYIVVPRIQTRQ